MSAYKLEDLDNMEFFRYSLFIACKQAENKTTKEQMESSSKGGGSNSEKVRYVEEANAHFS